MSAVEQRRFVQAVPANGDLIHACELWGEGGWRYPEWREMDPTSRPGRTLSRALCGVRGVDSWGSGGMVASLDADKDPIEFDADNIPAPKVGWNGRDVNAVCPRCVSKVRAALRAINGGVS